MQQEADVALDQLHHPINVHHRLLVPLAEIRTHFCLKVLQLTHKHTHFVKAEIKCHATLMPATYLWGLQAAIQALDVLVKF